MKKSLVLAPALVLSCALVHLVPLACFAQQEASSARLEAIAVAPEANATASPGLPAASAPSASPSPAPLSPEGPRRIGVGAKVSLLGVGGEVAVSLGKRINLRGGFNDFSYKDNFSRNGVNYAATLALRSAEAHFDFFPFAGGFHLSPGLLFYNDNHIAATVNEPPNQSFTLGNTSYFSSPANPVSGAAKLSFNKAAPSFTIGFGNLIPRSRRRFSFTTELGVAYTGAPKATLNLQGTICTNVFTPTGMVTPCVNAAQDPTVQSNIQSEETKINHDVSVIKIYPLASFGFGVNF